MACWSRQQLHSVLPHLQVCVLPKEDLYIYIQMGVMKNTYRGVLQVYSKFKIVSGLCLNTSCHSVSFYVLNETFTGSIIVSNL